MTIIPFGGECFIGGSGCVRKIDNGCSGNGVSQETEAPVIYSSLQMWHLNQVHDLLTRTFWSGIDSTSLVSPVLPRFDQEQSATPCSTNRNLQRSLRRINGSWSESQSSAHPRKHTSRIWR